MTTFDDGSLVWSRSSPKQKFWPSVVFNSWEAASKAGFVPDGIAYLIEFGRKVDITDAEAAPDKGNLLNLYLGDNAEWEFIPGNDSYMLPFLEHRDVLSRQRLGAQMKHQFGPALAAANAMLEGKRGAAGGSNNSPSPSQGISKRAGVLLDFGTGTSFSSFAELWNYLLYNGWTTAPGKGLATWYYVPPGSDPKKRNPVLDVDFFTSEQMVINHVRKTGLERPAPVSTVVKKSGRRASGPASSTRTSSRMSESRAKSAKRSRSNTPAKSKSKQRTSLAAAPSTASTVTKSEEASTAGVQPLAKVAAAAAPAVADKGGRSNKGDKNRCESSSRVEDRGAVSAEIDSNGAGNDAVESVDSGHGKRTGGEIDDGRGELSFTGEDEQKGGRKNCPSSSGGNGFHVKETVTESRKDRHARRSGRQEEVHSGSKRSHGRTMQVEATNMSSGRGSSNSTGEVSRQTVVARGLASSPPPPSPSKRPKKRGGTSPTHREMLRLANKQIKHLRGLLSGTERPYPSPYGLDGPIYEIAGFMKEAHGAWLARQAGTSGPTSRAKGALVVAGRSGTGKSTAYQEATRLVSSGEKNGSTFRFVTIKCAQLGGNPNEVFLRVLAAVTGPSSTKMEADNALEALSKTTEQPPFLPMLCLENVEKLEQTALDRLLTMAAQEKALFAIVCLVGSVDIGEEITYNQGNLERECNMVAMLGCKEDKLRAILGQSLGAADADDKDGEMIASLVNKGALDVIAKTVARVCGSVRIALNVCEVAFAERVRELEQIVGGAQVRESGEAVAADGPSTPYSGGASSAPAPAPLSPPSPFLSSPKGGAGASGVLLTIAGAKGALNRYLVQRPEAVWGGDEAEEQNPP